MSRALIGVAAALALTACTPPPVSMAPPRVTPAPGQYEKTVVRWTRHGRVIYDFDEALQIEATLFGPEMRAAYAAKWAEVYKLNAAEADKTRAQMEAEDADSWEIHLESTSHNFDVDNLQPSKKLWRVTLLDDRGRSVVPTDVKLDRNRREMIVVFYPAAGTFTRSWILRFPKLAGDGQPLVGPDTKQVILRFAGPQGATDLVWKLQ